MIQDQNYTTKADWANYYSRNFKPRSADNVTFSDIFSKFLTVNPGKTALEIGCAGGIYLAHFVKKYGYQPFGIDYSDTIETTNITFRHNGLEQPTLIKADFFSWRPRDKFDLVCSVGFVEHFEDLDSVVRRHSDLVAPGGILIITLPHFSGFQRFFHGILDKENLQKHNISSMNPLRLKSAMSGLPFELKYLDYYKTFGFWTERNRESFSSLEKVAFWSIRKFGKIAQIMFGYNYPNRWLSPHIVLIAQRTK